ncbi:MAG: esterase/lipase family protein [Candidatus Berkiella sp.]
MTKSDQLVVLLHGIARTSLSMRPIEKTLERKGYSTLNIHYPSRTNTIDNLATFVYEKMREHPLEHQSVHFVTHSMGGLVVRALLTQHAIANVSRIVMLAPPNHGSEVADFIHLYQPFKAFYGPALSELTTLRAKQHPFAAIPSQYELGVIAGSFNIDPICYFMLPKGHDGKVSIKSTQLPGMKDHLILPSGHSFMMYNPKVLEQITYFLANGHFFRENNNSPKTT